MTTIPATPAPTATVRTALLAVNMPRHRALLDVVTACGAKIGPAWIREAAPYESVTCAQCRDGGREFRQARREA